MTARRAAVPLRAAALVRRVLILAASVLPLTGCLSIPPTVAPMPSISAVKSQPSNRTLLIMLPGMGDRADTFLKTGFLDGGDEWGFDVLAVDAHLGYYRERTLIPRLHEDIVVPARANGYENIWLLGISMGGFGALLYAQEHPEEIGGVILLAPYVGDSGLATEIMTAGGLRSWSGKADGFNDFEINVWTWLKNVTSRPGGTPVILGYGRSDRLADAYDPLVEALDPSLVFTLEGGHNWGTWTPLWASIVENIDL